MDNTPFIKDAEEGIKIIMRGLDICKKSCPSQVPMYEAMLVEHKTWVANLTARRGYNE